MTKHKKNIRTKRRSQKGGAWYNPMSWFVGSQPEDPYAEKKSVLDSATEAIQSGITKTDNFVGTTASNIGTVASDTVSNVKDSLLGLFDSNNTPPATTTTTLPPATTTTLPPATTTTLPPATTTTLPPATNIMGGRRRRRARSMKGGKGGLGLTYYATPVSGLRVAEPTTWQFYANGTNQYSVKGGSRKRRGHKSRITRRHKKY